MDVLEKILNDRINRKQLINEFQKSIWDDEDANEILKELAYDLDFYEPDQNLRKQEQSYYGDERLEREIVRVIEKLKSDN